MITKQEPVYKEKKYCTKCKNAYEVYSNECNVCGFHLAASFKFDERNSDMIQFRALRSMRDYNIKMGNI